jgi:hypothetical protein
MHVTFTEESGGSRVILEVRTQGIMPTIAGWVLAIGSYRGSFRSQVHSFVRVAERERLGRLIL